MQIPSCVLKFPAKKQLSIVYSITSFKKKRELSTVVYRQYQFTLVCLAWFLRHYSISSRWQWGHLRQYSSLAVTSAKFFLLLYDKLKIYLGIRIRIIIWGKENVIFGCHNFRVIPTDYVVWNVALKIVQVRIHTGY